MGEVLTAGDCWSEAGSKKASSVLPSSSDPDPIRSSGELPPTRGAAQKSDVKPYMMGEACRRGSNESGPANTNARFAVPRLCNFFWLVLGAAFLLLRAAHTQHTMVGHTHTAPKTYF